MKLLRSLGTLHLALAFSLLAHAAVLTVQLVHPQGLQRVWHDTPLDVILVNARAEQAPAQAQAIAQANLAGGGEADAGRATSPLPPAVVERSGDALQEQQRRMQDMQAQQNRLLAQLRQQVAAIAPLPAAPAPPDPQALAQEERRLALLQALAEIEQRINEQNARPRKRYLGPATREAVYAVYYDQLRRRIEDHGTANFPQLDGRKLYGELSMVITVNHNGQVLDTEVVQGSGLPALDSRAEAIVQSLSFGPFTQAMRRQTDQIVVVSRFRFSRDETLQTRVGSR
ncbi:periplasmic protein TonB, links inner and outer membranes [Serpentinimonas raichei]|uniref:Periplasmic protein TonB, links inner and outer membranes n=1 Tax=Serpentinimonas raichei TaxID=1458425 RepID=A0A060NIH3_9BURK|nr:TonB family protein [Serpentinimonas raichei]BAO81846.1 periplasmic protein TonB, links inner and outer membranes [Serpentinimonas raichei]